MNDELLANDKQTNKDVFESLFKEYHQKVYAIAYNILGNESDAMDAAQEVFIKVYKSLKKFKGNSSIMTWIYRITINVCHDELRRQNRFRTVSIEWFSENGNDLASNMSSPEDAVISSLKKEEIQKAMDTLSDDFRLAFILRDIMGLSYDAIAETLFIPVGTVKSRIARARNAILKEIQKSPELFDNKSV
jgi:RNA polymerase sigma-70 factor (ECF subfamily)